jgi:hypothetical protein
MRWRRRADRGEARPTKAYLDDVLAKIDKDEE